MSSVAVGRHPRAEAIANGVVSRFVTMLATDCWSRVHSIVAPVAAIDDPLTLAL
jgi:hypothetical protein